MSALSSGDCTLPFASNSRTSFMVARVPSMREDRTASCVKSGESSTRELGIACSRLSYRATAPNANPMMFRQ